MAEIKMSPTELRICSDKWLNLENDLTVIVNSLNASLDVIRDEALRTPGLKEKYIILSEAYKRIENNLVENFNYINQFFMEQLARYNKLSEDVTEAASELSDDLSVVGNNNNNGEQLN